MSKKDSHFKYVSAEILSNSDKSGFTLKPRTLFPEDQFESNSNLTHRRTLSNKLTESTTPGTSGSFLTSVRQRLGKTETSDSWPKTNPAKRSGSCAPALGGRRGMGESSSETRLDLPQRQDSLELCWSEEVFRVEDLVKLFGKSFPMIVKVVHGFSGGDGSELDLADEQILQLFNQGSQRRVVLKDSEGRDFSLPLSYPLSCRPIHKNRAYGTPQTLERIVSGAELPIEIQVTGHAQHSDETTAPVTAGLLGSVLRVTSLYESNYAVAHVIKEGWLNTTNHLTLPQELNPVFRIALGIKGAEQEVWKDYSGMFARTARDSRMLQISGYPGIIYSSWSRRCHCCRIRDSSPHSDEQLVDEPSIILASLQHHEPAILNMTSEFSTITQTTVTSSSTAHKPLTSAQSTPAYKPMTQAQEMIMSSHLNSPSSGSHQSLTSHKSMTSADDRARQKPVTSSKVAHHSGNKARTRSISSVRASDVITASQYTPVPIPPNSRNPVQDSGVKKCVLKRRNSSYLPSSAQMSVSEIDPNLNDSVLNSYQDLSSIRDQSIITDNKSPTKRSVPFMGTRDITDKFTYCNFKIATSTPKSNLASNSPSNKNHKRLTVRFLHSEGTDDKCIVQFDDNGNSEPLSISDLSLNESITSDDTGHLPKDCNDTVERVSTLVNDYDTIIDNSATLSSICGSIDDGYSTKESTISSAGSVTYRKQYSPVYF